MPETRDEAPQTAGGSRAPRYLLAAGLVAVLAAILGIASRVRDKSALGEATRKSAAPVVSVIVAESGAPKEEILLPGNVQAFTDAPIYARTSGYLKKRYVDIGARVTKGQRLADIDSPEIEQQLQQARADLGTAEANEHVAKLTADRYTELVKTDSVSKQDADNAAGELAARRAAVESARANVRRLEQLVSFQQIDAPFEGVITARNTDIGQLIDPGSSGGPARELFRIAATATLRVYANVPQAQSGAAQPGLSVNLTFAERPGRVFQGKVVRTANAIDPGTRTLLVEIALDNASGEILPGAYAEVHLKLATRTPAVLLPVSALMFRAEGTRVAVLTGGNKATLVPVTLGRDYGTRVEVTSGIEPGAAVIDSPPDSIVDGQEVAIAKPAAKKDAAR
jgi:RND family efflux transporter MFP subunit